MSPEYVCPYVKGAQERRSRRRTDPEAATRLAAVGRAENFEQGCDFASWLVRTSALRSFLRRTALVVAAREAILASLFGEGDNRLLAKTPLQTARAIC